MDGTEAPARPAPERRSRPDRRGVRAAGREVRAAPAGGPGAQAASGSRYCFQVAGIVGDPDDDALLDVPEVASDEMPDSDVEE